MSMEEFIAKLPKTELHVHLEGTMTTDLLLKLAERNGIDVGTREYLESRRSNYSDFMEFVEVYDINCSVICNPTDLYEIAYEYFKVCERECILYSEVAFASVLYQDQGFEFSQVIEPLLQASADAEKNLGVKSNWILTLVKHLPLEKNIKSLRDSIPYKDKIIGLGIAGPEVGFPARNFESVYDEARRIGYKNFTAHSGEFGDPRCIIDTLYHLKVKRIDHGVRCLNDPYLVKFLADSDIWLTVCPLSNYHLNVLKTFFEGKHVINELLEKGIKITINSDDPPLLGGFLNKNYMTVADIFSFKGEAEAKRILIKLAKDSFRASFLPNETKEEYYQMIDNYALTLQ
jgi:adenosine deaminase